MMVVFVQYKELFTMLSNPDDPPPTIKFKEDHVNWRDEDGEGNTLLHLAAWQGNVHLAKSIFNSIKARKLVNVVNKKGASPLAMAIISGQVPL